MAYITANLTLETVTTTGTGAYTLGGAVVGHRTFSAVPGIANGDLVDYTVRAVDSNRSPTGAFEIGTGTWSSGTITRTSIEDSSNAGAAVNWAAGTKEIMISLSAETLKRAREGSVLMTNLGTVSGAVTLDLSVARAFKFELSGHVTLSIINGSSTYGVREEVGLYINCNGFAMTWPASVLWAFNAAPALSVDAQDFIELTSFDGWATAIGGPRVSRYAVRGGPIYRYWKLYVTFSQSSAGWGGVNEMELRTTVGGADITTPSTTVTTIGWEAASATALLDNNTTTAAGRGGNGITGGFVIDLGSPTSVSEVMIFPYSQYGATPSGPRDFTIQGSMDGAIYTTVRTVTGYSMATNIAHTFSLV